MSTAAERAGTRTVSVAGCAWGRSGVATISRRGLGILTFAVAALLKCGLTITTPHLSFSRPNTESGSGHLQRLQRERVAKLRVPDPLLVFATQGVNLSPAGQRL